MVNDSLIKEMVMDILGHSAFTVIKYYCYVIFYNFVLCLVIGTWKIKPLLLLSLCSLEL